ncbi:MAG TPA: TylF/MycF/NovP-related O-methyltransferase [Pirellulales bacterium]
MSSVAIPSTGQGGATGPTFLHAGAAPAQQATELSAKTCLGVSVIALAAAGKLAADQQRMVQEHLANCTACQKLRNQLTEQLAAWSGRFLYKGHLVWLNDWAWLKPYEKYLGPDAANGMPKTRVIDRRFTLIQFARAVKQLRGSTAECGVLGGVGSAMICKTLQQTYQDDEQHWGFDSFEGLPEPEKIDISPQSWQKKGSLAISPQVALNNLADFDFCTLVKGWIPQCFEPAATHRFRLVHIDLDLYQPTIDSLEFFYPRTNPGGVFVLDDYGHLTCPGVRQAVDEFFRDKPEPVMESVCGTAFVFKAAKT